MPALTFYCPKKVAEKIRAEAVAKGGSISKEVSKIIQNYYQTKKKKESATRFSKIAKVKDIEGALKDIHREREYDRV